MTTLFAMITAGILVAPLRSWPYLGGLAALASAGSGCWGFAVLFTLMGLDPWASGLRASSLRRRNVERHAKMLARNFHDRPAYTPDCAVLTARNSRQARSGIKGWPESWTACSGHVGQAHFGRARGMGGCNSEPADDHENPVTVYLCHAHHQEQERGDTRFEAKYGIKLKEAARAQHRGLGDLLL